jgi:hypothetical protein
MLSENYKTSFFNFLENFHKYDNSFKIITEKFQKINWNKQFILKLNEMLMMNNNIENMKNLNIFKNTNINNIWDVIDIENKNKYLDDLNNVISLGKIMKLNDSLLDNNNNNLIVNKLNEQFGNIVSKFSSLNETEINNKIEEIYKYVSTNFSNEFNIITNIIKKEENFINSIIETISKINMDNIDLNINDLLQSKNKNKIIEKLINNFKLNNPEINLIYDQVLEKINLYKDDLAKIIENNDADKIKKLIYHVMNSFELKSHNFDFVNMFLKYAGISGGQKTNTQKKKDKELRRKKARCNYRKKLKRKYNNKRK